MSNICYTCSFRENYYRGKNKKDGCLMVAFCVCPKLPKDEYFRGAPKKILQVYRDYIKIKTHPRWCPLKIAEGKA